jgi:hypothetical protein
MINYRNYSTTYFFHWAQMSGKDQDPVRSVINWPPGFESESADPDPKKYLRIHKIVSEHQLLSGNMSSYGTGTTCCDLYPTCGVSGHRVHRVATAAFWRTFSHEGKISPGW